LPEGETPSGEMEADLLKAYTYHLAYVLGRDEHTVTDPDRLCSLSLALRREIVERWQVSNRKHIGKRRVSYLSMEFLVGRTLSNILLNLELEDEAAGMLSRVGTKLEDLEGLEHDPGLGNGGLGRLAACFMESLATLAIPACGYGLRYEYGMFQQNLEDGFQVERPDTWLVGGNPWEVMRPELQYTIRYYGSVQYHHSDDSNHVAEWTDTHDVIAVAYDTPVPGYRNDTVNTLRLWSSTAVDDFDLGRFNEGEYLAASEQKLQAESITRVLYPNDNIMAGRELRLKQEYLFVSATLQDIIRSYRQDHDTFDAFPEAHVIQLNDTHPALAIPELMHILVDKEGIEWDKAWDLTARTFAFTNHTVLPEALEQWPVGLLEHVLPRHLQIIYEINRHFLRELGYRYLGDLPRQSRMSIISEDGDKMVRMAHLAIVGSSAVNGVAELHSQILREHVFKDFYRFWPTKFHNVTNGVTPRRWLRACNPDLAVLITDCIGDGWIRDLSLLRGLEAFVEDGEFQSRWRRVKTDNKRRFGAWVDEILGVQLDTDAMFDCQIKRIHEYKRQLLNVLHVITLYNRIKASSAELSVPRIVLFAGKAAPGYDKAKLIIKLITSVAETVNGDPDVGNRLKVLFLPDYNVSLAEKLMPAADLSEQISTAGKEASGTGNMKFALNGALTIGTRDGANIEIAEEVGQENIYMFGLSADEVQKAHQEGYEPRQYFEENAELRQAIEMIDRDDFSSGKPDLFKPLTHELLYEGDQYMLLADYAAYVAAQDDVAKLYGAPNAWTKKSILNCAGSGKFSSDRAIRDYAKDIWKIAPSAI
jgi:glycogen phosphorylase